MQINEEIAAWAAGIGVAIGGVWRMVFRGRQDVREDKIASAQQKGYSALVDELQQEVDRLAKMVRDMGSKLDREIAKRMEVEVENHALRLRVAHLEAAVKNLGGTL